MSVGCQCALPTDAVYFGEISLSGAVRPVAQTSARLKEAANSLWPRDTAESAVATPGVMPACC